jgi:hypothetical protein
VLLATTALLAVVHLALIVAIDPYRMFGTPAVAGLTRLKPAADRQAGTAKPYMMLRVAPATLLLGNSRVEVGFDPESPAWPAACRPVFNASQSGATLDVALDRLRLALHHGKLKLVVVAVDFADTVLPSDRLPGLPGAAEALRPLSLFGRLSDEAGTVFNAEALADSIATLAGQDRRYGQDLTASGYHPLHEYDLEVARAGYASLFAQKEKTYRATLAALPRPDATGVPAAGAPEPPFAHPERSRSLRALQAIVGEATAHGARVIVLVHPYHARLTSLWKEYGFLPQFTAFRRALPGIVAEAAHGGLAQVVDAADAHPIVDEPVPPVGDVRDAMQWYWEAGHYKAALGDRLIRHFAGLETLPGVAGVAADPPLCR